MMRKIIWEASATGMNKEVTPSLGIQFLPKIVERYSHYRTAVDRPKLGIDS